MKFLDWFTKSSPSASANVARERLQIIIAHQSEDSQLIKKLEQDIIQVMSKYFPGIDEDLVNIQLDRNADHSVLQLDLTIPEKSDA